MELPRLLWVNMRDGQNTPPAQFAQHVQVCAIEAHELFATLRLSTAADVICFDFDHPDMTGLKLATDTKTAFPSIPLLILLEQQSPDIMLWALRVRIFDVLVKPTTVQEIANCMARLLPALQARRQQSGRQIISRQEAMPPITRYRSRSKVRDGLRAVLNHINKHYTDTFHESDLAKKCNMSAHRFSKAFKVVYGVTFCDYVCELRFKHAKHLLENPKISVTDVATMSGFSDPSYFARLFRSRAGMTPTQYRQLILSKADPVNDAPADVPKLRVTR